MKTASRIFMLTTLVFFIAGQLYAQNTTGSSAKKDAPQSSTIAAVTQGKFVDNNKNGICDNWEAKHPSGKSNVDKSCSGKNQCSASCKGNLKSCGKGCTDCKGCGVNCKGQEKANCCGKGQGQGSCNGCQHRHGACAEGNSQSSQPDKVQTK